MTQAVTVAAPDVQPLSVQVLVPNGFRPGRPFRGEVVYKNNGNTDIPAPILTLSTGGAAGLRLNDADPYSTDDLVLIGTSLDGDAGVIRPGRQYAISFTAETPTDAILNISVRATTGDSTAPIDYGTLSKQLRPTTGASDSDWAAFMQALRDEAGPTYAGYVRVLAAESSLLARRGAADFVSQAAVTEGLVSDGLKLVQARAVGTVTLGDTGRPLAGVDVILSNADGSKGSSDVTDVDGSFHIPYLLPGTYSIEVPGYLLPAPLQVVVPASGVAPAISVVVGRGGLIEGTVRRSSDGSRLAGLVVDAVGGGLTFDATTDADGTYLISGLPTGSYSISVGTSPFVPQRVPSVSVSSASFVAPGIDFALALGAGVQGQVVAGGKPLAGASVTLLSGTTVVGSGTTDSAGHYTIGGVPAGSYTLEAQAEGLLPASESVALVAGATTAATTLSPSSAGAVKVTIVDASAKPIAGAAVELTEGDGEVGFAYTGADGTAAFSNIPGGTVVVLARAVGYGTVSDTIAAAGGTPVVKTYTLSPDGVISGKVTDGAGVAISGLPVNVAGVDPSGNPIYGQVQTQADGSYAVGDVPFGTYALTFGSDAGVVRRDVAVDAAHLNPTLDVVIAGATFHGRLLDADGKPAPARSEVDLSQGGPILATASTLPDGSYRFRALTPGTYQVTGGDASGVSQTATVVVAAGGDATAPTLTVGSITQTGTVTDSRGTPVPNAYVAFVPLADTIQAVRFQAITDASGKFTLSGLSAGQYLAEVEPGTALALATTINVSGDSARTLVVPDGQDVSGQVTATADGTPVPDAVVRFLDPTTQVLIAETISDATGHYSVAGLPARSYDVLALADGFSVRQRAGVAVAPGSPTTLDLGLAASSSTIGGTVLDASGAPVADATVSILNAAGELVHDLATDLQGNWSTGAIAPGTYTITVGLLGYHEDRTDGVEVVGGVNPALDATLVVAGTDDGSNYETIPTGLDPAGAALLEAQRGSVLDVLLLPSTDHLVPRPVDQFSDAVPYIVCPDGSHDPNVDAAYNKAIRDLMTKDAAFQNYLETYDNFQSAAGRDIFLTLNGPLQTFNSALQLVVGPTVNYGWAALSNGVKAGVLGVQAASFGLGARDFRQSVHDLGASIANGTVVPDDVGGVIQNDVTFGLSVASSNFERLGASKFLPDLSRSAGGSSALGVLGNSVSVYANFNSALAEFDDSEKDYDTARDAYTNAEIYYLAAGRRFRRLPLGLPQHQPELPDGPASAPAAPAQAHRPERPSHGPPATISGPQRPHHRRIRPPGLHPARHADPLHHRLRQQADRHRRRARSHHHRHARPFARLVDRPARHDLVQWDNLGHPGRLERFRRDGDRPDRPEPGVRPRRVRPEGRHADLDVRVDRPSDPSARRGPARRVPAARQCPRAGRRVGRVHRPAPRRARRRRGDPRHGVDRLRSQRADPHADRPEHNLRHGPPGRRDRPAVPDHDADIRRLMDERRRRGGAGNRPFRRVRLDRRRAAPAVPPRDDGQLGSLRRRGRAHLRFRGRRDRQRRQRPGRADRLSDQHHHPHTRRRLRPHGLGRSRAADRGRVGVRGQRHDRRSGGPRRLGHRRLRRRFCPAGAARPHRRDVQPFPRLRRLRHLHADNHRKRSLGYAGRRDVDRCRHPGDRHPGGRRAAGLGARSRAGRIRHHALSRVARKDALAR